MSEQDRSPTGALSGGALGAGPQQLVELGELPGEPAADRLAELEHCWIGDRVDNPTIVLVTADDAGAVEDAKVLRDRLLRRFRVIGQPLDSRVAVSQQVEQADARRLAEDAEPRSDDLDDRLVAPIRGLRPLAWHG